MFYRRASSYCAGEVERLLEKSRFAPAGWEQTLALRLADTRQVEALHAGRGQCAFAVVAAERRSVSRDLVSF